MIRIIVILISLLPLCMNGQYTYFNMSYQPLFPAIGSGDVGSLTVSGDSLIAYSCTPIQGENARRVTVVGPNGELVRDDWFPIGNVVHVVDYSDTVYPLEQGGYCWSGTVGGVWPIILWMNEQFEIIQSIEHPELFNDSTWTNVLQSAEMNNGDIVSAGRMAHIYGPMPGQLYANLVLFRHDSLAGEVWMREYTLDDLDITIDYGGPFAFPRGGLFELSNGDILLFGSIGNPLDCYAIKFDSEGNYLDHVKWGHAQYGDGSPWPVKIGEDEFAIGYGVFAFETNDNYVFTRPRIGWLSAPNMELLLGNFFDHPYCFGGVTDMERSPDGGFVMLGKGKEDLDMSTPGKAFLLKLDEDGNEEWYYTYVPPEAEYHTESAYDLEMTPDGGMAFVGNYFSYESMNYVTWIVKTDACGELEFNGCGPQVGVTEASAEDEFLLVYPNPAGGSVQISWQGEAQRMDVFNASGHLVESQAITPWVNSLNVDFSPLAPGIYHIRLVDEQGNLIGQERIIMQ